MHYTNVIKDKLLDEAIANGITTNVVSEIEKVVAQMPAGAVMLCACSTLGGVAEEIGKTQNKTVIRIDRPMAEKAVEIGGRVGVAAALESTMEPTNDLLQQVARERRASIKTDFLHIASAWDRKTAGDAAGYISEIRSYLNEHATGYDVIVLAQGSMAPAAQGLAFASPPILTSVEPGIERALELVQS